VFATAPFVHRDSKPCFNNWVVEKRKIETLLSSVYICPACNTGIIEGGLSAQHLAVIKKPLRENPGKSTDVRRE
jgi:hypothetical protein